MNWEEQWFIAKLGCSLLQHFILHNPHLKIIAADFLHAVEFIKVDKKLRNGSLIHVYILYSHDKSATLAGKSCRFHTATKTARKLLHVFRTRSLSAFRQTRPPHNVFIAMLQLRPLCHLLKKKGNIWPRIFVQTFCHPSFRLAPTRYSLCPLLSRIKLLLQSETLAYLNLNNDFFFSNARAFLFNMYEQ